MIHGRCACGRIQYQVPAQEKPPEVNACHCQTCQLQSGGPFLAFVAVPTAEVQWTTRAPDMWEAPGHLAERGFCSVCGSTLSMRYHFQRDRIDLTLGSVVQAEPPLPGIGAHIFLGEKAPWFVLPDDGAQRLQRFSAGFTEKMEQWKKQRQAHG